MSERRSFKYLISGEYDDLWGITVDNVGESSISPGYEHYPPLIGHPQTYYFNIEKGRVLDNYQLIYISQGRGWYCESPEKRIEIPSGSLLIIPQYTWHSYYPDKKTGWQEYWIGLSGEHIDSRYKNGFFSQNKIIHKIGYREHFVALYKEAIDIAFKQKAGFQQVLASIANSILAYAIYYDRNGYYSKSLIAEKMDQARSIMRENMLSNISAEEIAERINMSYSWFRKTFKEYTNVSPAHYITQLKLQTAKSLLINSTMSVKEIAFHLNYEDAAYFSAIFKKYVGTSPSEFRAACTENTGDL